MNIQTIRKNVQQELNSIKDKIPTNTYKSLDNKFKQLISYYENEKGKKIYPKNKKSLLSFSWFLKGFTGTKNTIEKVKKEKKEKIAKMKIEYNKIMDEPVKIIEMYIDIYIADPFYDGFHVIIYNEMIYRPRSREEFYLSKKTKLNSNFLYKHLSKYHLIPDYEYEVYNEKTKNLDDSSFKNMISEFNEYNDFKNVYDDVTRYHDVLLVIKSLKMEDPKDAPIEFQKAEAFDDLNSVYLSNPFIKYDQLNNDEKTIYKNGYVKKNYIKRSCWYSLIIDIFKVPIENYRKKIVLNYQSLQDIMKKNILLGKDENGATYNDVVNFFIFFKIALRTFDVNMNLIPEMCYEPEKRNNNFSPQILYVVFHNKHIYHLNHNLESLCKKISKVNSIIEAPSNNYYLKKCDNLDDVLLIYTFEDLQKVIYDKNKTGNIRLIYQDESCKDLWIKLYSEMKYEANILMKDGKLDFTNLRLMNINEKNIMIDTYQEKDVYYLNSELQDNKKFKNYILKKNNAIDHLLNKNYISYYSEQVDEMLKKYKKPPLHGAFDYFEETIQCSMLDFNKFYTSILNSLEYLPVINRFDNFVDYKNEIIEDYNLYFVLNEDLDYPVNPYSLCFGMNIKDVDVKIISFLKPSKLKKNCGMDIIKDLYNDETLSPTMRKNIINHIIGKYNKGKNTKFSATLFRDEGECNYAVKKYGGIKKKLRIDENTTLNVNYIEKSTNLNEGFKLLSLLIYDVSHKILMNLKKNLESLDIQCYKCNTDCIYFEQNESKLLEFKNKFPDYFNYIDKNSYDGIGKLKFEDNLEINGKNVLCKEYWGNIYKPVEDTVINHIQLKNEFDINEIINKMDNKKIIIKADVAGAGKTYSFEQYCKLNDKKGLFITPYNALCNDLKKKGFNSITFHKLMGLRFDGVNIKEGTESKEISSLIDEVDIIIFDEIYLYDTSCLQKIKDFMMKHKDMQFGATGDEYQLNPIEKLNIKDTKKYYNRIISNMFHNQITLHENKRCKTDEDRKKIKEITFAIRNSKSKQEALIILFENFNIIKDKNAIKNFKNNVCALNDTAEWVNDIVHIKENDEKYYEGMEILCKTSYKGKGKRTFVNYTYEILAVEENDIVVGDDDDNIFFFTKGEMEKYFKLSYARTCHSLQGMSINEKICIFDIGHYWVNIDWIYTAITRTTDLKNINIYRGEMYKSVFDLNKCIDTMILGHKRADINRKKYGEYVTREWVLDELKNNKHCSLPDCHRYLDVSNAGCFSIDRIDNNLCHSIENCQIICRRCQSKKR